MIIEQTALTFDKKFAKKLKIAVVRTNYHSEIVDNLESFGRATLIAAGVQEKNISTFTAPGSWEIPLLVKYVAQTKKFHAIMAFGVLVKGDTHYFDLIATEVASALMQLSIDYSIPVAFEVLAVYNKLHAEQRSAKDTNNKGIEAAKVVLQMLQTLKPLKK